MLETKTTVKHVKTYSVPGGGRFARFNLCQPDGVVLRTVDVLIRGRNDVFEIPMREAKAKAKKRFVEQS